MSHHPLQITILFTPLSTSNQQEKQALFNNFNYLSQCFSTFSVKRQFCSNFDCSWNPCFWGTPGAQRAKIRGRRLRGVIGEGAASPRHQLGSLGEHCKLLQRGLGQSTDCRYILDQEPRNASSDRKCRTQFNFLLSTGGPAEPLDTTGGTLRRTPVEKH